MSIEENKAIVRRWSEELWSQGDLAVVDELVSPDYVRHDPGDPFPARGRDDIKRLVGMLRTMLPDLTIEIRHGGRRGQGRHPLHRPRHGHRGFNGSVTHRQGDPDGGDPDLSHRGRPDRRELGDAR
jgi:hypothetical protein